MADKKADSIQADVLAEIKRLAATKKWEVEGWTPENNAIVIVRAILTIAGDTELMEDTAESREERLALCNAILPILKSGAAINFEREVLIPLAISPRKMGKAEKVADKLSGV